MTGRVLVWAGGVVAVAAAAGLGVYFVVVGLDEADKVASVAGAFIGLAGLVVAVYGLVRARNDTPASPAGGQSVTGSAVGGGITQVKGVTGSLRLGAPSPSPSAPPGPATVPPAPTTPTTSAPGGGQSVTDSQVDGGVRQVDGVGGDADIDR